MIKSYIFTTAFTLGVFSILHAQSNLSPVTRFLQQPEVSEASKLSLLPAADKAVSCLIQVSENIDEDALLSLGATVNTRAGNVWTVSLPLQSLSKLAAVQGVQYVDVSTRFNSAQPLSDIERQATKVDKVHNGTSNGLPQNYYGKGVIMGIVDFGFQTNNPTFYNETGTRNRIMRYWNQSDESGTPPAGYTYGSEWADSASIEAHYDMNDQSMHGTHVAGIAAGSGYTSPNLQYRGVAPQSDLVLVKFKRENDTIGPGPIADVVVKHTSIIDAYKYIFDYAETVGKPAVINLSAGSRIGPHDGTSLLDKAIGNLVKPGHIVITAAGNDNESEMHLTHEFSGDTISTIMYELDREYYSTENLYADFWGSANTAMSMKVTVLDNNGAEVVSTPFVSSATDKNNMFNLVSGNDTFHISVLCENSFINNNKPNITIIAFNPDPASYYMAVSATAASGRFDGWNMGASQDYTFGGFTNVTNNFDYSSTFLTGDDNNLINEYGGASSAVITVGATVARNEYINIYGDTTDNSWAEVGDITWFSSKGPTTDNRIKPDLTAPGFNVPSATNRYAMQPDYFEYIVSESVFRNDTNYWIVFDGTSMASPMVAGVVAMMLEANPALSPAQVRDVLRNTADKDAFTGSSANSVFGWGKVNAYEAVKQALYIKLGINALQHTDRSVLVFPNPAGSSCGLVISHFKQGAADISVTNLLGQQVLQKRIAITSDSHQEELLLDTLSSGMYMLTVSDGITSYSVKLLKD